MDPQYHFEHSSVDLDRMNAHPSRTSYTVGLQAFTSLLQVNRANETAKEKRNTSLHHTPHPDSRGRSSNIPMRGSKRSAGGVKKLENMFEPPSPSRTGSSQSTTYRYSKVGEATTLDPIERKLSATMVYRTVRHMTKRANTGNSSSVAVDDDNKDKETKGGHQVKAPSNEARECHCRYGEVSFA